MKARRTNGPQLVCAGCGDPTTLHKPICDACLQIYDSGSWRKLGLPSCALCVAGLQRSEHGQHLTARGGYAGPCEAFESRGRNEAGPIAAAASIPDETETPVYQLADKSQ